MTLGIQRVQTVPLRARALTLPFRSAVTDESFKTAHEEADKHIKEARNALEKVLLGVQNLEDVPELGNRIGVASRRLAVIQSLLDPNAPHITKSFLAFSDRAFGFFGTFAAAKRNIPDASEEELEAIVANRGDYAKRMQEQNGALNGILETLNTTQLNYHRGPWQ